MNVEWGLTLECLESEDDYFEFDAMFHMKPMKIEVMCFVSSQESREVASTLISPIEAHITYLM